jgi:hypothetical protein
MSAWLVAACSSITPHENFISQLQSNVGKMFGVDQRHGMVPSELIQSRALSSDKIENEYRYVGTCRLFFVINLKTKIVESARHEGSDNDCSISN